MRPAEKQLLDNLVEQRTEKVATAKNRSLRYVGLEHIAQGSPRLLGSLPADSSTSVNSVFLKGDILFGKLRPNLRKSWLATFDGYCSTDILVLRARKDLNVRFAAHLFQFEPVFREAVRTSEGTKMPRTSWEKLKRFAVFCPDREVQGAIAHVLDAIDAEIEETERLISKLRMIEDGLLADILDCTRLRLTTVHLGEIIGPIVSGWSPNCDPAAPAFEQWGVLKTTAVVWDGFKPAESKTLPVSEKPKPDLAVREGDILLTRKGPRHRVAVAVYAHAATPYLMIPDTVFRFRLKNGSGVLPAFLALSLRRNETQVFFDRRKIGLAESQVDINHRVLKAAPVAFPHISEQQDILDIASSARSRIEAEQDFLAKMIGVREGLMADVLSGRVTVPISAKVAA